MTYLKIVSSSAFESLFLGVDPGVDRVRRRRRADAARPSCTSRSGTVEIYSLIADVGA